MKMKTPEVYSRALDMHSLHHEDATLAVVMRQAACCASEGKVENSTFPVRFLSRVHFASQSLRLLGP